MNKKLFWTLLSTVTLGLSSCTSIQTADVSIKPLDVTAELATERSESATVAAKSEGVIEAPASLTEDLLSLTQIPDDDKYLDIEAYERPAELFFADLGRSQNLNILLDPRVNQNITLSLRHVTLKQIISALQDSYGFDFQKTDYGYRVAPSQISTRIYRLNYLNIERSGSSKTQIGGDETNTVTTSFSALSSGDESSFWSTIQRSIEGLVDADLNNSKSVVVNPQTGLLVVSATTEEHSEIAQFLADAQLIIQKQVIIEAKIVEVILDQEYRSGINWSFLNDSFGSESSSAGIGLSGETLSGTSGAGGIFNVSLSLDNFTSVLQLLDYQGDAQVLSSPRVSTVNNQKAVIKVGADEYFATVSSVTTDIVEDANGNNTVEATPTIELEQFFSGIALDVTPQIDENDNVMLHVRPTVTEVTEQTKLIEFGGEQYSLPVAYSNIRESDSIIRAKSGQIVVIGGLLQQSKDTGTTAIPWFGKLPVVRLLFAQDRESQAKSELVILLKPTVFDGNTTTNEIDRVLKRFE